QHERYKAEAYSGKEGEFFAALQRGEGEDALLAMVHGLFEDTWLGPQMGKGMDWFIVGYLKGGIAECLRYLMFGALVERLNTNEPSVGLQAAFRRALRPIPSRIDTRSFKIEFRYEP
ncbi:MAG TPA: hypothetical protein VKY89_19470, partial [Thermoanaerobaculia bacterium]|nr:hypothetical protein [Thermoanaerobaculia bacterium]